MTNLGWLNDGGRVAEKITKRRHACQDARDRGEAHDLLVNEDFQRCQHSYGCRTCGFSYQVDSGG